MLSLPDLEPSKSAAMNSLTSASSKRCDDHAIRKFIELYAGTGRTPRIPNWSSVLVLAG
jgi:hypothetical protein